MQDAQTNDKIETAHRNDGREELNSVETTPAIREATQATWTGVSGELPAEAQKRWDDSLKGRHFVATFLIWLSSLCQLLPYFHDVFPVTRDAITHLLPRAPKLEFIFFGIPLGIPLGIPYFHPILICASS
ncbi:hypothetical protein N7528_006830 [Penicillium herquei]|nr:hypothetical protein N7528_006830 [Penicillium herquei]